MRVKHGGDIYQNRVDLDFSVNVNPLGPPEKVEEALHKAVGKCRDYPDMETAELKRVVGKMLGVSGECLLFGNGASELFLGITHALKPEKTLIPVPSFYGYEYAAEAAGSDIVYLPLRGEEDFQPGAALTEALTEETDLLFLADPNNPTGKRLDGKYCKNILEHCRQRGIYVVLDECFIEFCAGGSSALGEIGKYPNLLLVRAFTKIYAIPGVRLGYLVCSDRALLEKVQSQLPEWNVSVFAQEAGIACAGQRGYVESTAEYVRGERVFLEKGLRELGIRVFPGEADFLLLYIKKDLYRGLLQRGILIRDCANFRGLTKGFYRVAVKKRQENERLLKAIGECIGQDGEAFAGGD